MSQIITFIPKQSLFNTPAWISGVHTKTRDRRGLRFTRRSNTAVRHDLVPLSLAVISVPRFTWRNRSGLNSQATWREWAERSLTSSSRQYLELASNRCEVLALYKFPFASSWKETYHNWHRQYGFLSLLITKLSFITLCFVKKIIFCLFLLF